MVSVPFLSIFFNSISIPPSPEAFEEPSQLLFGHKWPTSHYECRLGHVIPVFLITGRGRQ